MKKQNEKGKTLTKKMVFEAARTIAARAVMPTLKSIRAQLGSSGSETTLHKYLSEWKKTLLKKASDKNWDLEQGETSDLNLLLQQKILLKETLERQIQQNEKLSAELFTAEREVAKFRENHAEQLHQISVLQTIFEDLKKDHEQLKAVYEAMSLERERAVAVVIEDKNQMLQRLQAELKETHQENLARIRDFSFKDHDLLMQEKVKTLNYEEKIKTLMEELRTLSAEYHKLKALVAPIRQKLEPQKKSLDQQLTAAQFAQGQVGSRDNE